MAIKTTFIIGFAFFLFIDYGGRNNINSDPNNSNENKNTIVDVEINPLKNSFFNHL